MISAGRAGGAVDAAVGWVSVGVVATGAAAAVLQRSGVAPARCAMRAALGLPCPTCGLTTAAVGLARLDVAAVLGRDPLGAVLLVGLAVVVLVCLVSVIRTGRVRVPAALPVGAGLVAVVVVRWIATVSGIVTLPV